VPTTCSSCDADFRILIRANFRIADDPLAASGASADRRDRPAQEAGNRVVLWRDHEHRSQSLTDKARSGERKGSRVDPAGGLSTLL
jgi:hypothetical protein